MSDVVGQPKRADARRNQQALLDAAAVVFVRSGVHAPVREVAAEAGVGMGTIYRHFPTRADLIVAVFRHQVEALVEAAPVLLDTEPTPRSALAAWADRFVDFLTTKHGLAEMLSSESEELGTLHAWFVETLAPACQSLLDAAAEAGEIRGDQRALELLRAIGGICYGQPGAGYDERRMVGLLLDGLAAGRPG